MYKGDIEVRFVKREMSDEARRTLALFGGGTSEHGDITTRRTCKWMPENLTYVKADPDGGTLREVLLPSDIDTIRRYLLKGWKIHEKEIRPFPPPKDKIGQAKVKERVEQYIAHQQSLKEWGNRIKCGLKEPRPLAPWEEVKEEQFICPICKKQYASKPALFGHSRAHTKGK